MYNNQCRVSKRQRVNQKDEDKSDPHHSNLKVTEDEDGGMNFRYSHSSPMLHSRCKLVDALSFHVAAIRHPVRREVLVNLRDACLNEAIECENRAAALYDVDVDDVDGVRAGYAWKIMHCLYGLEVAASTSSNSQPRDDITVNAKEELRKEVTEKRRRVIESLELLAPTSSRFANDWLGCVYATENDGCVRALEKFQSSLDIGERWSDMLDADEETAENGGLAVRRTTANLALCFLAMGDTNAPLELLLHLWMTLTESSSESSIVNNRTKPRAIALLLSPDGYEFESANRPGQFTKLQILWKLFQTSSIAQDWSTCLNATEEIAIHGKDCNDWQDESRVELARAFALLQCRRTSAAQDITRTLLLSASRDENKMRPRQLLSASLLQSIVALYHADALLLNEQIINYHDEVDTPYCTQRAVAAVDASLRTLVSDGGHVIPSNAPLRELQITAYNDHAISLIMSGDSVGALRYFREASKLSTVVCRTPAQDVQLCWLILPTFYNLSLLLMRDGHVEESAKSWLQLRGHFSLWQQARRGDDDALRRMKELCATAINLHGLLVAKRSVQGNAMLWDQENILEWVPPAAIAQDDATEDSIRVGGVDALQITALDALLLNYASSTAEKKSSSSFRRRAGRLG